VIPPPRKASEAASPQPAAPPKKEKAAKDGPSKSGLIAVMLVLLALILAVGAALYFVAKEMGNDIAPPVAIPPGGDANVKEAQYIRVGWQKDAYDLLRDFIAATTSRGKLPYILNGEPLAQELEDFYGGGVINDTDTPAEVFSVYELSESDRKRGLFMMVYDQPPQFDMKEFFRPLASLEVQFGIDEADFLLGTLSRAENFIMEPLRVHAFFKRTQEGLKLDWEVFAQTKYRTFQNFIELPETGRAKVFRVFIAEDVPDSRRAAAGFRTYRLADPANTSDTARVNVEVDSDIGRELSVINWRGTENGRPIHRTATVELVWVGDEDFPELRIQRFICWEFLGLGGEEATSETAPE
jgi:hypothetical protein